MAASTCKLTRHPFATSNPAAAKPPLGYLWLANDPHGSLYYHWGISRGQSALIETIGEDYTGILQCDGWSAYETYEGNHPEVLFMSCLAHIRRKFFDYYDSAKDQKTNSKALRQTWFILNHMRQLYRIEAELSKAKADPRLRQAVRASQNHAIVTRLTKVFNLLAKKFRRSHLTHLRERRGKREMRSSLRCCLIKFCWSKVDEPFQFVQSKHHHG